MTDDLVEFLRARLDEQEARLHALPAGPWEWRRFDDVTDLGWRDCLMGQDGISLLASAEGEGDQSWIKRHKAFDPYLQDIQPARILADIEAKRAMLALHDDLDSGGHECPARDSLGEFFTAYVTPSECPTLRLLALPYADHPDYREEWRP